jgi:hypothetical protein
MHPDLAGRIMEIIADETRCHPSRLRLETDLWDIGVDGDDARDLLLRLSEEFEINLENMQFHRHFGPEGTNLFAVLLPGWWRWRRERIPVRIADLVEAAHTRTWPVQYSGGPSA